MTFVSDPLQYVKGVGPHKSKLFKRRGITSIEDLMYYFPYRHEDRSRFVRIADIKPGESYTLKGTIRTKGAKTSWRRKNFHILELILEDESGHLVIVWFNQLYLNNYLKVDQRIIVFGKVESYQGRLQMIAPDFEIIEGDDDSLSVGRIVPIYSAIERMSQRFLRNLVKRVLDTYVSKLTDPLPYNIRNKYNLLNLAQSLINIHFPESIQIHEAAYRRLAFEEFFMYQIPVLTRKLQRGKKRGITHTLGGELFGGIFTSLPFHLTAAQERVLAQIQSDMKQPIPMQRLLQGEVGSGKTVVALLAAAIALDGRYQVAFMAPTEILAKQHFQTLKAFFEASGVANAISHRLLVSSMKKKEKDSIHEGLHEGVIRLIVGTHALIQEGVVFDNLGLVIIDEQHKFGVAQRGLLAKKGKNPDVLIMTATPIPRTLSMTIYGDLDVSILDELPKGRKQAKTVSFGEQQLDAAYDFVRSIVQQGKQVYVICPFIEESRDQDIKAAEAVYEQLQHDVFKELRVGLIHGRLNTKDSDAVMKAFKEGKVDILVSTSVLEVGIDIPNATCMVVLQAERFGLLQLHQLRGRICRSQDDSFFVVVSNPRTPEAKLRIQAISKIADGFRIAEEDLRIRGPGEFFGRRQHGLSVLKIANPLTQLRLLKAAREEAAALLRTDPLLSARPNQELAGKIKKTFPRFPQVDFII